MNIKHQYFFLIVFLILRGSCDITHNTPNSLISTMPTHAYTPHLFQFSLNKLCLSQAKLYYLKKQIYFILLYFLFCLFLKFISYWSNIVENNEW